MPSAMITLAFTILETEIENPIWLECLPKALQGFSQLAFRQMQQAGAGPDAVVGGDFMNVGKAAPSYRQAGECLRQFDKFCGCIECGDSAALLKKSLAVPPRAASSIEDMCAARQL